MAFDPGRMRHLATFNAPTRVSDGAGGYTTSPAAPIAVLRDVPVEMTPVRTGERIRAMQVDVQPEQVIRMWYDENVTAHMTMTVDGVTYEIVSQPLSPLNETELLEFSVRAQTPITATVVPIDG